jgi:integrase
MDDNIINDPKINQWFKVIRASKATREIYAGYIKKYCKIAGKTPSELIAESIAEYKAGKLPSERSDFEHITAFLDVLEEEDYAPKSVALMLSIVRSFYKAFDIQISESVGKNQDNEVLEGNVNFLPREDVIKMITHARTLRDRAIILCMVSSGMARANITDLKIGDIEFENGIGVIGRKRRSKSRADFITFLSPEACKALQDYFSERNMSDEEKDKDGNIYSTKIKGDDDYVFVTYKTNSSKPGQQITKFSFIKTFERLAEDLSLTNSAAGGFILSRSHALRKFFATNMQKSGMPKNYIDFMMGHKLKELDFAYFQNDLETMKKLYIEHLPCITFDKALEVRSLDTKDAKMLEELKVENISLNDQVQKLQGIVDKLHNFQDENDALVAQEGQSNNAIGIYETQIEELKKQMKIQQDAFEKEVLKLILENKKEKA